MNSLQTNMDLNEGAASIAIIIKEIESQLSAIYKFYQNYILFSILILIAVCVFWGLVSRYINSNRGYKGGFWWGFFLHFAGVIIVGLKRDNK